MAKAQLNPSVTPLSPNSAAFEKYGVVPVNLSSGVISPSIPLLTIPVGKNNFNVGISYSSQGLRVDELPTNVGMGWSLNLGSITRIVKDLPDEDNNARISNIVTPISGSNNFHIGFTLNSIERLDSERDIFTVNVDGYQTKFLIDDDLSIVKLTIDDIDIDIINPIKDAASTKNKLRVITPNGNQYFFGGNGGIETSRSRNNQSGPDPNVIRHANAWLLSEVKYPDKNGFTVYYQRNDLWYRDGLSQTSEIIFPLASNTESGFPKVLPSENHSFNSKVYVATPVLIQGENFVVNFQIGEFEDVIDSQAIFPKIEGITLKSNIFDIKKIKFSYESFNSTGVGMHKDSFPIKRPFLKAVILNDDSSGRSSYNMEYYNPNEIPQRFSFAQDLLGYYNGKNNSKFIYNSLPEYNNLPEYELIYPDKVIFNDLLYKVLGDRKPNVLFAKNGTLKKITYPTGGHTSFGFEGNLTDTREVVYPPRTIGAINLPASTVANGGGSHYKEISVTVPFDQNLYISNSTLTTENPQTCTHTTSQLTVSWEGNPIYFYKVSDQGLTTIAQAMYFEMGDVSYFNEELQERTYIKLEAGKTYKMRMISPRCTHSVVNFLYYATAPFDGDFVEAGGLRIKSVTNYDHNDNFISGKKFEYYDGDFTVDKPVSTFDGKDIVVGVIDDIINQVTSILFTKSYVLASTPRWSIKNNAGEFFTYLQVIEKDVDSAGLSKGYIAHYFERNRPKIPTNIQNFPTSYSNLSNFKYKTNEILTQFYDSQDILKKSIYNNFDVDKVRYNNYYKSYTSKSTVQTKCVYQENIYQIVECPQYTLFGLADSDARHWSIMTSYDKPEWSFLSSRITMEYQNGSPLSTKTQYFYNNSAHFQPTSQKTIFPDFLTEETFYKYAQEKGNQKLIDSNMVGIPLETETRKNGITISKIETKYNNNDNLLPSSTLSENLQNGGLYTDFTYDKYDDRGNLLQYTSKDGVPTTIIWGYGKSQPIAKIVGAMYPTPDLKAGMIPQSLVDDIVSASNLDAAQPVGSPETAFLTKLDAFRNNALLKDFQITTYTYDPLVGVRSITPPSGIREYYLYDTANRLIEVRDVDGKVLKSYEYHYKQ